MAEDESLEKVLSARKLLKTSLETSEDLSSAIDRTGSKLEDIRKQLPYLEAQVEKQRLGFSSPVDHVDQLIALGAAVMSVFSSIEDLQQSLVSSNRCSDIQTYISMIKHLEDALKFLSNSCSLAIIWFEDIVDLLKHNGSADDGLCTLTVQKPLRILHDLQKLEGQARLNRGILSIAFDRLENDFMDVLKEGALLDQALHAPTLQRLQSIVETLYVNKRLDNCVSAYAEYRTSVVRRCFEALGTDYMEILITELDDVQDIEGHIDQWSKHLDIAVNDVYELEHRLCNQVFEKAGRDVPSSCFSEIATNSGLISLLRFGLSISNCKKDPIKLLKLLDVFSALDNLRVQFNRLFGAQQCSKIQKLTRELVKRLVDCISEIFWELPYQVELQRATSPPPDGGVPRLVSFVTEYCNQLVGSHYKPILTKILEIDQNWKNEKYHEELLISQVYNILKEIAMNLDSWSISYRDATLSYFFMMNNHCHFCNLKETHLGSMMGDSWLRAHEQYRDYYMAFYLRESWGKLHALFNHKGQLVPASPIKRKYVRESIKKTLHKFSESFDQIHIKQSTWVITDERLRQKLCHVAVQAVVPAYKNYLQNWMMLLVEEDPANPSKYVKYTAQGLESKLKTMFQVNVMKNESNKKTDFVSKVKNAEISQFRLTLTAT